MKAKFEKSKPYGTITPPYNGAVYHQDGRYFGVNGDVLWCDEGVSEEVTPPKPKIEKQVVATSDIDGNYVEEEIEVEVLPEDPEGDLKVELAEWLRGERKLHHNSVTAKIKKAFGVVRGSTDEQIDYLVNEAELVPAEDVRI